MNGTFRVPAVPVPYNTKSFAVRPPTAVEFVLTTVKVLSSVIGVGTEKVKELLKVKVNLLEVAVRADE